MLVDANLLLFAVDLASPFHRAAAEWMEKSLNGPRRVGFPWPVITAFLRIGTHPRALERPMTPEESWAYVSEWLAPDVSWIPTPTAGHAEILSSMVLDHQLRGNLVSDAHLAALALEHGLTVCSADTDFARFTEISWVNPLAG